MATDQDIQALQRLAERSDDDLLALVGILDGDPDVRIDALVRLLDPSLAESLEADGLLPRPAFDIQGLRQRGRARIEEYLASRREELRNLICPLATPDRNLLVTLGPAALADAVAHLGAEPTAALLALVVWVLTRSVEELCSDWQPPTGGVSPAFG